MLACGLCGGSDAKPHNAIERRDGFHGEVAPALPQLLTAMDAGDVAAPIAAVIRKHGFTSHTLEMFVRKREHWDTQHQLCRSALRFVLSSLPPRPASSSEAPSSAAAPRHGPVASGSGSAPPAPPPPPVFSDDQTAFLTEWFSDYASDPTAEIEVRIKGVQASEFDRMLHRLSSSKSWSSHTTTCKVDVSLPGEVRGSYEPGQPHTLACMSKRRIERPVDLQALPPYGMHVRFSLSRETPVPSPSSDAAVQAAVTSGFCRIKSRHTFVHKGQFAYELTRVQTGRGEAAAMRAPPEGEVEIEWCGQRVVAVDAEPHTLATSMLSKVADLVRMVQGFRIPAVHGGGGGGGEGVVRH